MRSAQHGSARRPPRRRSSAGFIACSLPAREIWYVKSGPSGVISHPGDLRFQGPGGTFTFEGCTLQLRLGIQVTRFAAVTVCRMFMGILLLGQATSQTLLLGQPTSQTLLLGSPLVKRCYWDSPLVKRCYSQARCDSYVPCMCPRLYTASGIENEPDTGERPSRVYNHFTRRKIKHTRVRVSKIHERPNSGSPKKTIGGEQSRLIVPLATFD